MWRQLGVRVFTLCLMAASALTALAQDDRHRGDADTTDISTGSSALDRLLGGGAASGPARAAARAKAAASAASDPQSDLRDALLREAAIMAESAGNRAADSESQSTAGARGPDVPGHPKASEERADEAAMSEGVRARLRSIVASIREHRDWLIGAGVLLAVLAMIGSLARGVSSSRGVSVGARQVPSARARRRR